MKIRRALEYGLVASIGFIGLVAEAEAAPVVCTLRWCNPFFYTVGTDPTGIALGDFNGDRHSDVAVAVQGSDKISILVNSGSDAELDPPFDIPLATGSAPHSVVAVDIDNDADLDLVVSRSGMNDIQVLTNSAGVFSLGATSGVGGTLPSEMAVGDLDDNGFTDVVTSNRGSANVSLMLNTAGVLAGGVPYSVGSSPLGLAVADLDGQDGLDVAVASADTGAVDILLNDGSGILVADSSLPVGAGLSPNGSVAAADFDGNGDIDISVVTSGSAGDFATVFLNSGSATFGSASHFDTDTFHINDDSGDPRGLVAADFELNGTVDLALTNVASDRMGNLVGDGSGNFDPPLLVLDRDAPEALAAADLDANGSDDLVSANRESDNIGVMLNRYVIFADGFEWGDTWAWSSQNP